METLSNARGVNMNGEFISLDTAKKLAKVEEVDKLRNGLYKILELNKFMVNCESEKVRMKTIMKQYSLIYEILGIPEPGLARCDKNESFNNI